MERLRSSWIPGGVGLLLTVLLLAPPESAKAQAVGFGPVIGAVPDGVGLSVTPVATADRRYVRLNGLNAGFTNVLGFDTATVGAAVGGGGVGVGFGSGGGFGGVGGFGAVGTGYGPYPYYPYGAGYPGAYPGDVGAPVPYGASPYQYGPSMPQPAQTTNALGALGSGIMGATSGRWRP